MKCQRKLYKHSYKHMIGYKYKLGTCKVLIMWWFFCILQQILCNGLMLVTSIFLAVICKVAVT
jgi:hypothetical protein